MKPFRERSEDWSVVLFLLALGVLITPALQIWATDGSHWLRIYALWGLLVFLVYALQPRGRDD
jgi:fatty acid desaturase